MYTNAAAAFSEPPYAHFLIDNCFFLTRNYSGHIIIFPSGKFCFHGDNKQIVRATAVPPRVGDSDAGRKCIHIFVYATCHYYVAIYIVHKQTHTQIIRKLKMKRFLLRIYTLKVASPLQKQRDR